MHIEPIDEIKAIVGRLSAIQKARGISNGQLLRDYPDIGSAKTWTHRLLPLLAGEALEGNVERALVRLKRVAAVLDGGSPDEEYYGWDQEANGGKGDGMGFAGEMMARLKKLEQQTNDRRILVCLAPNGCGKSAFARWAVAQDRANRCYVRMRPTWRNRSVHICTGIARALGLTTQSTNPAEVEQAVIEGLSAQPKTLFVDQAHEGGVQLMHELRAFVDETPSRFVYLAYDTAFKRVQTASTDALIEAQAFLGRCLKPCFDLYRNGILNEDVNFYLRKRGGLSVSQAESVTAKILPALQGHTNLRLLDDAIQAAEAAIEEAKAAPDRKGNVERLDDLVIKKVVEKTTGVREVGE